MINLSEVWQYGDFHRRQSCQIYLWMWQEETSLQIVFMQALSEDKMWRLCSSRGDGYAHYHYFEYY